MKRSLVLALLALTISACAGLATLGPTPVHAQLAPELTLMDTVAVTHNIPAVLDLPGYDGQIAYVCATLPRAYFDGHGHVQYEIDHYVQLAPCPARPID